MEYKRTRVTDSKASIHSNLLQVAKNDLSSVFTFSSDKQYGGSDLTEENAIGGMGGGVGVFKKSKNDKNSK